MTSLEQVARMALGALEEIHPGNMTPMAESNWSKAIAAIREVLAQLEQPQSEPVAWLFTNVQSGDIEVSTDPDDKQGEREYWHPEPLYTSPPQRQPEGCAECGAASTDDSMHALYCVPCAEEFFKRQPLPDDEAWQIFEQARAGSVKPVGVLRGIRAIERAHGIGGEA